MDIIFPCNIMNSLQCNIKAFTTSDISQFLVITHTFINSKEKNKSLNSLHSLKEVNTQNSYKICWHTWWGSLVLNPKYCVSALHMVTHSDVFPHRQQLLNNSLVHQAYCLWIIHSAWNCINSNISPWQTTLAFWLSITTKIMKYFWVHCCKPQAKNYTVCPV